MAWLRGSRKQSTSNIIRLRHLVRDEENMLRRATTCDIDELLGIVEPAASRKATRAFWINRPERNLLVPIASMIEPPESRKNLNTILLAIVIGVISWVALTTHNSSVQLAEIKGSMVSRQEIETKIAEINAKTEATKSETTTRILALDKDLTALKLALAERGITHVEKK